MDGKKCEHLGRNGPCSLGAVFRVSRGRKHDAQDSCRRHLAATVEALEEGEGRSVTVALICTPLPAPARAILTGEPERRLEVNERGWPTGNYISADGTRTMVDASGPDLPYLADPVVILSRDDGKYAEEHARWAEHDRQHG